MSHARSASGQATAFLYSSCVVATIILVTCYGVCILELNSTVELLKDTQCESFKFDLHTHKSKVTDDADPKTSAPGDSLGKLRLTMILEYASCVCG